MDIASENKEHLENTSLNKLMFPLYFFVTIDGYHMLPLNKCHIEIQLWALHFFETATDKQEKMHSTSVHQRKVELGK